MPAHLPVRSRDARGAVSGHARRGRGTCPDDTEMNCDRVAVPRRTASQAVKFPPPLRRPCPAQSDGLTDNLAVASLAKAGAAAICDVLFIGC